MVTAVIDIETNRDWDHIWCVGVCIENQEPQLAFNVDELHRMLCGVQRVVGHNIIGFDLPILRGVWGFNWNLAVHDTLVIGRLLDPAIEPITNASGVHRGHSLKAWSVRAGDEIKDDFDPANFDLGYTEEMGSYCLQDTKATWSVYRMMETLVEERGFSWASVELEHRVRELTTIQESNGFEFDFPRACNIYTQHTERMSDIEQELQAVFPPIIEERYSDKTGKRLKDRVTVFNPGSRQQVADRLTAKGAVWKELTPGGKPKVDETTLEQNSHVPEATLVLEYLTLGKRSGMLRSWLDSMSADGRIHGRVNTCGAITGRMSHSGPNVAQVPSDRLYRECWTAAEGNVLVGVDASGLELRMLAHYMNDPEYTDLILHGDIHTHNQKLAGLPTRNDAKTFIYALLYGAGDGKLGSIVGGSSRQGSVMRKRFFSGLPAYGALMSRINKIIAKSGTLPGLDGRRLNVRSEHSALNTLLQSAGAIVMKKALVLASDALKKSGVPYKLVAQVHDEFQIEASPEHAEFVGATFRQAIIDAGLAFEMRCPLDGEAKIGNTWADTH